RHRCTEMAHLQRQQIRRSLGTPQDRHSLVLRKCPYISIDDRATVDAHECALAKKPLLLKQDFLPQPLIGLYVGPHHARFSLYAMNSTHHNEAVINSAMTCPARGVINHGKSHRSTHKFFIPLSENEAIFRNIWNLVTLMRLVNDPPHRMNIAQ